MYPGGKNGPGTYQTIINQIPPHSIYAELFAGSAAIFQNKMRSDISLLCDSVLEVCDHLKKINIPGAIILNCDSVKSINIFVTLFNILHTCSHRVFVYLDPPYPINSRTSQRKIYQHELSDEDHITLLKGIIPSQFPIAISSYKNEIYADHLKNWRLLTFQSTTRNGLATEYLYMNYPEPSHLHDYSHIGNNFREREKYSRIKKNVIRKLNTMPDILLESIFQELSKK